MKRLLTAPLLAILTLAALVGVAGCSSGGKTGKLTAPQPVPSAGDSGAGLMRHLLAGPFPEVPPLQLELPAAYVAERVDGRDFTVFYLRNRSLKAGVGIYLGPAPQYHHQRDPYLSVRAEKGALGARQVEWRRYEDKGLYYAETIVPDVFKSLSQKEDDRLATMKMHLFLAAPNPALLRELEAAAGRLQVRDSPKP